MLQRIKTVSVFVVSAVISGLCGYFITILGNRAEEDVRTIWLILKFLELACYCAVAGMVLLAYHWLFYRLPRSFLMRFSFYRKDQVKNLAPIVQEAVELDRAYRLRAESYDDSMAGFDDYQSQVRLIQSKLAELGINVEFTRIDNWEVFIRELSVFAHHGSYENVRGLCERWRERL